MLKVMEKILGPFQTRFAEELESVNPRLFQNGRLVEIASSEDELSREIRKYHHLSVCHYFINIKGSSNNDDLK